MILSHETVEKWSLGSKLLFRFVCLYFFAYIFFMFFGGALRSFIEWVGLDLLGIEGRYDNFGTGSGDTTKSYIKTFIQLAIAVFGLGIWSMLDRKRPSYNQFLYWLTVLIRVYLIYYLFVYGFIKIFKAQFPSASLNRLMQPLGEMSPMGLAWTYMGHSAGFNMFTGFMEVLGGLLLIPRRTQTFGAFITMGVMTHVAMMNLFYDIPVKLFSIHIVMFAAFLFYINAPQFLKVFFLNQPTKKIQYFRVTNDKHYRQLVMWLKIVLTVLLVGSFSMRGYKSERSYGDKREHPPLRGIWEVTSFVKNGDTIAPLITDKERWRFLIVDRKERALIRTMNDSSKYTSFLVDEAAGKIYITAKEGVDDSFIYSQTSEEYLRLDGKMGRDTVNISLKARDLSKMPLTSRGFHWINEYPYNR